MSRRTVLLEALAATPRDLARMARRLDQAAATWQPAPDAWCIADVVAHLSDIEGQWLARLRCVVAEELPRVHLFVPGEASHNLSLPLSELVEEFAAQRAATITFLQSLEQRDWGRQLIHETIGLTRLRDQVQAMVAHDNEHLAQVVAIREALEVCG